MQLTMRARFHSGFNHSASMAIVLRIAHVFYQLPCSRQMSDIEVGGSSTATASAVPPPISTRQTRRICRNCGKHAPPLEAPGACQSYLQGEGAHAGRGGCTGPRKRERWCSCGSVSYKELLPYYILQGQLLQQTAKASATLTPVKAEGAQESGGGAEAQCEDSSFIIGVKRVIGCQSGEISVEYSLVCHIPFVIFGPPASVPAQCLVAKTCSSSYFRSFPGWTGTDETVYLWHNHSLLKRHN